MWVNHIKSSNANNNCVVPGVFALLGCYAVVFVMGLASGCDGSHQSVHLDVPVFDVGAGLAKFPLRSLSRTNSCILLTHT